MKTNRTEFQEMMIAIIEENFQNERFSNKDLFIKAKEKDPNMTIYQVNAFLQKMNYVIQFKDKTFSLDYNKLNIVDKKLMTAQDVRDLIIKKQEENKAQREKEVNAELVKIMGSIRSKAATLDTQIQVESVKDYKEELVSELVKLGFSVESNTEDVMIMVKW